MCVCVCETDEVYDRTSCIIDLSFQPFRMVKIDMVGCFCSFRGGVRAAHLVSLIHQSAVSSLSSPFFRMQSIFFVRFVECWLLLFQSNLCLILSLIPRSYAAGAAADAIFSLADSLFVSRSS